jgi:hypothetical protein
MAEGKPHVQIPNRVERVFCEEFCESMERKAARRNTMQCRK